MAIKHGSIKCILIVFILLAGKLHAGLDINHWQTQNGARVYFVASNALPIVDVRVVFDAGSARNGDKPGLALLTSSLLDQGAGDWSADDIAERMENVGAQLGSGALRDMGWLTVRSLSDPTYLNIAVNTLAELIEHPQFPQDAIERQRKRLLVGLQMEQESPSDIAEKTFYRLVYSEHPYGEHPNGTATSLVALTHADVVAFHRKYYVAKNAVIAIVGALSKPEAIKLAEQIIGNLSAGQRAPALKAVASLDSEVKKMLYHPSTQTHIWVGQPGVSRTDPAYFPLYVGNHILGGSGLISIVSQKIREEKGLAYSAYSYFHPMRDKGPFILGMQTRNDQAEVAKAMLMKILRSYMKDGPSAKQLASALKNITGGFPLRIDSNKKIVEYLGMIGFYDLPLDYLDTFNQKITAVNQNDIRQALQKYLNPDQMVTVTVGGSKEDKTKAKVPTQIGQ